MLSSLGIGKFLFQEPPIETQIILLKTIKLEGAEKVIERVVEVPFEVTIEVEREIITPLTDWIDVAELRAFLIKYEANTVVRLVANKEGTITFDGFCEERALQLIDRAGEQGKRLFFVPLHRVEYKKWYGKTIGEGHYHAICGALIGDNEFWYIEPSDGRCWLALYLD